MCSTSYAAAQNNLQVVELKAETSSRTLSAPGSDACALFSESIPDKVNSIKSNINIYYLNTNKVGLYMFLSVFLC